MTVELSLDEAVTIPQHVVHRTFAAETVILNLETGKYHGLNPSGGRMLDLIERHGRLDEVAEKLSQLYGRPLAEMQIDLLNFCRDLLSRGLITVASV